jgi:hypothetical protein
MWMKREVASGLILIFWTQFAMTQKSFEFNPAIQSHHLYQFLSQFDDLHCEKFLASTGRYVDDLEARRAILIRWVRTLRLVCPGLKNALFVPAGVGGLGIEVEELVVLGGVAVKVFWFLANKHLVRAAGNEGELSIV